MKYLQLTDPLILYLNRCHHQAKDPLLAALRRETAALGDVARMQISAEQGAFLTILTAALGAKRVLEIGTFTGYSALCLARGLAPQGTLVCLDQDETWTNMARRFWEQAGLASHIDLRLGPALASLTALAKNPPFDLAFIDADKTQYDTYYERVLPLVRTGGLILFDNMLWSGRILEDKPQDEATRALDALNHKLTADDRVDNVLLPLADGIQLCRKR